MYNFWVYLPHAGKWVNKFIFFGSLFLYFFPSLIFHRDSPRSSHRVLPGKMPENPGKMNPDERFAHSSKAGISAFPDGYLAFQTIVIRD
jgi:hypothetical protein